MGEVRITPQTKSWVACDPESEFSLSNIPFGIISTASNPSPRVATALSYWTVDLSVLPWERNESPSLPRNLQDVFKQPTLNAFAALGPQVVREVREFLQLILAESSDYRFAPFRDALLEGGLVPGFHVTMHLPMAIGDYTDFYAGMHHAVAVGTMFRGANNALQPNYKHLPVGYHGRSSSIVVSGTPVYRPRGQILDPSSADPKLPTTGPSKKLDFELELGCFISRPNKMGEAIGVDDAEEYIFGYVLLNDWSARDIQSWEYVPLGPFNGKNFASTISPWVVVPDALRPFKSSGIANDTTLQPYLEEELKENVYDLQLEVDLKSSDEDTATTITRTSSKHLLWSFPQMIAHHTLGGCPLRTGDLLGSGTISGTTREESGSLLEMSENGRQAIAVGQGERAFLKDGDILTLRGFAGPTNARVGFGECSGRICAAL